MGNMVGPTRAMTPWIGENPEADSDVRGTGAMQRVPSQVIKLSSEAIIVEAVEVATNRVPVPYGMNAANAT